MRHLTAVFLALGATNFITVAAVSQDAPPTQMKCETGPLSKSYGGAAWLVYGCNDHRSLVIVSAPGNPATPFYFLFHPQGNGYQLEGEGTGRKEATAAAFGELKTLSERDIVALIAETEASKK
jgi:hypothetical protein